MEEVIQSKSGFRLARSELFTYVVVAFLVVLWCHYKWSIRRFERVAAKMTGPPVYPIIGSGLEFVGNQERMEKNIHFIICITYMDIILVF